MTPFEKNIGKLDFHFKKRNDEGGVILTKDFLKKADQLSPQEIFAIETALHFEADAVYFRHFDDGRGAVPQIYIYDNTNLDLTEEKRRNIHIKVWSGCQVPIFIVVDKIEVRIFDAREKVKINIANHALETIQLTGKALKSFSASSFDDGLFWEEKGNEKNFQFATSAYRDLISGLKNVYTDFQDTSNLNSHVALKLLVQCLLIKYLEERDDESAHGYFTKTYFKSHFKCNDFCEVIRRGKLLDLLDKMAGDFNGKIFEWDVQDEKKERAEIRRAEVRSLADYLDGNIENEQYVIWRLYSFSHLPIELISSVYEELLTNSKDIVYTPEMVVATLIDECMPLKNPKESFKVVDVSCGSGIFLVKAYKRIIQWWRYKQWQETKNLKKPDLPTLKKLLTENIFGIDIQGDAIRLSVFSLALALLDEVDLSPPVWQKLKFPDLSDKNIVEADFFEFISHDHLSDFDLVIGNPPFNPPAKSNGDKVSNGEYFKKIKTKFGYQSEIKIPDDNPALHFLVQAMKLLKPNAMLCLIQPSGPLIYQKDQNFKVAFFSKYNLLQILDFTKLADILWGKKNVATAAIFLQNALPDNGQVTHIVVNRTSANVKRLFLELDPYDFHVICKEAIVADPFIWKANSLGGGRLVELLNRLFVPFTLGSYLKVKEKFGWKVGEGFKVEGEETRADFITGKDFIPVDGLTEKGIDAHKIIKCTIKYFHRPRNKFLYSPPHILIREIIGNEKIPMAYSQSYLTFRSGIVGIHAPTKDEDELKELFDYLQSNNELFRFFIIITSGRLQIGKATAINKEDLMNIPYSRDLIKHKTSTAERILINDVVNYQFNNSENNLLANSSPDQIREFTKIFSRTLNSVYKTDNRNFQVYKILDTGNYYALHFVYDSKRHTAPIETTEDLEEYIKEFIPTRKKDGRSYHIQKLLKLYSKDTIIIAKPKQHRYWLKSIALRDADETFADYVKAGF